MGEIPLKCEFCNKTFKEKSHLLENEKNYISEKSVECRHWQKKFIKIKYILTELFQCNFCDESFSIKSSLRCHQKTYLNQE